jgi:septal ring factor EnvC (AmiA/AmiB activator)
MIQRYYLYESKDDGKFVPIVGSTTLPNNKIGVLLSDYESEMDKLTGFMNTQVARKQRDIEGQEKQIAALTADLKIANGGINTLDELIERKDKTISILTAENEKYREALEDIAKQRIKKELTPAERDNADYEYGFEYTVENARKTLEPSEPEHECEYEMGHCVICGKDMSGFRQTEGGGR